MAIDQNLQYQVNHEGKTASIFDSQLFTHLMTMDMDQVIDHLRMVDWQDTFVVVQFLFHSRQQADC